MDSLCFIIQLATRIHHRSQLTLSTNSSRRLPAPGDPIPAATTSVGSPKRWWVWNQAQHGRCRLVGDMFMMFTIIFARNRDINGDLMVINPLVMEFSWLAGGDFQLGMVLIIPKLTNSRTIIFQRGWLKPPSSTMWGPRSIAFSWWT